MGETNNVAALSLKLQAKEMNVKTKILETLQLIPLAKVCIIVIYNLLSLIYLKMF